MVGETVILAILAAVKNATNAASLATLPAIAHKMIATVVATVVVPGDASKLATLVEVTATGLGIVPKARNATTVI
jgi:hypothetical protein